MSSLLSVTEGERVIQGDAPLHTSVRLYNRVQAERLFLPVPMPNRGRMRG